MRQSGSCVHSQKPPHTRGAPGLTGTEQDLLMPCVGPRLRADTCGRGREKKSTGCPGTGEDIANDV